MGTEKKTAPDALAEYMDRGGVELGFNDLKNLLDKVETYSKVLFTRKYKDIFTTPNKTQRMVFDLLGIKYVYKGQPQNDDLTPPEEL